MDSDAPPSSICLAAPIRAAKTNVQLRKEITDITVKADAQLAETDKDVDYAKYVAAAEASSRRRAEQERDSAQQELTFVLDMPQYAAQRAATVFEQQRDSARAAAEAAKEEYRLVMEENTRLRNRVRSLSESLQRTSEQSMAWLDKYCSERDRRRRVQREFERTKTNLQWRTAELEALYEQTSADNVCFDPAKPAQRRYKWADRLCSAACLGVEHHQLLHRCSHGVQGVYLTAAHCAMLLDALLCDLGGCMCQCLRPTW